jgi:glycosyltransferase involved in cell wall biosynthesis
MMRFKNDKPAQIVPATVAVIIPCRNMARFLARALISLLAQDVPDLHIIVVDNNSSDDSPAIARSFGDAVTLLHCPRPGANNARNLGLAATSADYLLFLDADDYLHGPYLKQLQHAINDQHADVVVGAYARSLNGVFSASETYRETAEPDGLLAQFLRNSYQSSVFLWRRSFVQAHGGWIPELPISQDFEFGLRLLLQNPSATFANPRDAFAVYWQYDSSGRITGSLDRRKAEARLGVLQRYKPALTARRAPAIDAALAARFYDVAAILFANSYTDLARAALAECADLGFKHPVPRQRLARLLGLEAKTKLASLFHRLFPNRPRPYPYNLVRPNHAEAPSQPPFASYFDAPTTPHSPAPP